MPLTLQVGLSKKVGLPNEGSLGASCQLDVELSAELLTHDLAAFHGEVQRAFAACRQAVQDELDRQADHLTTTNHPQSDAGGEQRHLRQGEGSAQAPRRDHTRRATASQVRSLCGIADYKRIDLDVLLRQRFAVASAADLSITAARDLINELRAAVRGPEEG